MKREKKLKPEELMEYLFINNPASVPEIAKALDVNPPTVQYWIDKLIENDIAEPIYGKRYGEKYRLKIQIRPKKTIIIPMLPTILLLYAIFLINTPLATIFALASGVIGTLTSWLYYRNTVREKIYRILKEKQI